MSKAKYLSLLGMAAMFESMSQPTEERKLSEEQLQHRIRDLERKKEAKQEELKRKKGLQKFRFGSNELWALNEKSADKKARKKGWLK